jgi:hypothetical protein
MLAAADMLAGLAARHPGISTSARACPSAYGAPRGTSPSATGWDRRLVRHPVRDAFENQTVCYDETIWIAQKSLAKCAPLMGELSALALDPVTYS